MAGIGPSSDLTIGSLAVCYKWLLLGTVQAQLLSTHHAGTKNIQHLRDLPILLGNPFFSGSLPDVPGRVGRYVIKAQWAS